MDEGDPRAMTDEQKIQRLKTLKDKFRALPAKERESLSVCFLKVKLTVHTESELKNVKGFLGDFKIALTPENLDSLINYIHSKSHTLPGFIAMEDSITEIEMADTQKIKKQILPEYNADDMETIREQIPVFKDDQ